MADLLVSYAGSVIASIAIASTLSMGDLLNLGANLEILSDDLKAMLTRLPPILVAAGIVSSLLAGVFLRLFKRVGPAAAPRFSILLTNLIFLVGTGVIVWRGGVRPHLFWAVLCGSLGGILIKTATEAYAKVSPLRRFTAGLDGCLIPLIGISTLSFVAHRLGGTYGVGMAALGILAAIGITLVVESLVPAPDRPGSQDDRTTIAGAAALTAATLFLAFRQTVDEKLSLVEQPLLEITTPRSAAGLLIGILLPFLIVLATRISAGSRIWIRFIAGLIVLASPVAVGMVLGHAALGLMLAGGIPVTLLLTFLGTNDKKPTGWQEMNLLIKLMGIVALLIIPRLV